MEVETAGNLKFGMGECAPQEDVCPSADGMSSDATVLCIDSDVDEEEQQAEYSADLEKRLKEKGLQGGPEPLSKFGAHAGQQGGKELGGVKDTKDSSRMYSLDELHKKRFGGSSLADSDLFKYVHAGKKISWGREQDLADVEASAVAAALRSLEVKKALGRARLAPFQAQEARWKGSETGRSQRRKKGNNNSGMLDSQKGGLCGGWVHERADKGDGNPAPQQGQQPRSNKRRGRRGGRGRKHADRNAAGEVPKLEKNLEEELAEQMANQASNESALAQSFSSLRLHVAGGGTMIILNDREITGNNSPEDILNEQDELLGNAFPTQSMGKVEGGKKVTTPTPVGLMPVKGMGLKNLTAGLPVRPGVFTALQPLRASRRGCGAFFPPHLLAQVQKGEKAATSQVRRTNNVPANAPPPSPSKKLNAQALPFVPVAGTPLASHHSRSLSQFSSVSKATTLHRSSTAMSAASAAGTGCFIPVYLQDEEQSAPCHKLLKASLVESLSSLSEVDFSVRRSRLKLQPPPQASTIGSDEGTEVVASTDSAEGHAASDTDDIIPEARSRIFKERSVSMGACSLMMRSMHRRSPTTPAEELLSIIDKEDEEEFTTFTSPLHLEETLEGLEAEQQALEETQEKMIDLEMENTDLKKTINNIDTLTTEINKLKCANTALQVLLFVALAKPENEKVIAEIPRGMYGATGLLGFRELEAVKEKLSTKSTELMQIQKALEKKNNELQDLSDTWLNGLTLRKEAAESPKTPTCSKEKSVMSSMGLPARPSAQFAIVSTEQSLPQAKPTVIRLPEAAADTLCKKPSLKTANLEEAPEVIRSASGRTKKSVFPTSVSVTKKTPVKPSWR